MARILPSRASCRKWVLPATDRTWLNRLDRRVSACTPGQSFTFYNNTAVNYMIDGPKVALVAGSSDSSTARPRRVLTRSQGDVVAVEARQGL